MNVRSRPGVAWIGLGMLAVCVLARTSDAGPPQYEVTAIIEGPDCGIYPSVTRGSGVNSFGEVVGYWDCGEGAFFPFYWSQESGLVPLDVGGAGDATAIDDSGRIVGGVEGQGFLLDGEELTLFGMPPSANFGGASDIGGDIVCGRWGHLGIGPPSRCFVWCDGRLIDLTPDLAMTYGHARAVNAVGQVTGTMWQIIFEDARAFIWHDGKVVDLGPIPGGYTSEGWDISEDGIVVGTGRYIDGETGEVHKHGFVWNGLEMIDIGNLPGFRFGSALSINSAHTVVGQAWHHEDNSVLSTGFVWQDGQMWDLRDLIPSNSTLEILSAWAISDAGHITGRGHNAVGVVVGFLLTPVEPRAGDLNRDGVVDGTDVNALLAHWGDSGGARADLNDDGVVNRHDLAVLLENWSHTQGRG